MHHSEDIAAPLPKKVIHVLVRSRTIPKIVRWAFLVFVFTMPFESIDLGAMQSVLSLTRLGGLLFFATCLLYPRLCFRRPPHALWWFAAYGALYVFNGLFIPSEYGGLFLDRLQTFLQLFVLCWIGSTLFQEEKLTRHALLTFSLATLLAATGMLLGLGGFAETSEGRVSVAGNNPNALAVLLGLTAQALLQFGIDPTLRNIWLRISSMALALLPLTAMVSTGSRGGILACLTGVAFYALPSRGSQRKVATLLAIAIAVVCVIYVVMHDQTASSRFERSYYSGDTARRDMLYAAAHDMMTEKPLLGWQPIVFNYELGARTGRKVVDAHNLLFHLLLEGGLIGATPFLLGLGCCVRAAWTARVSPLGLLPLVWLITMLVANTSGTWITAKIFWLVFALTLASGAVAVQQHTRRNTILRAML